MRALAAAAWPRSTARSIRNGDGRGSRIETLASLAAIALLSALAAASILEQSPAEPGETQEGAGGASLDPALAVPAREFMIGAYSGAPYTYPSDVTVKKEGVHDFTVKDVGWDGEPFENPIYYGARIVRWLSGGRTGAMVDFTHSKTIARRGDEAELLGTIGGKPAPARAKIGDVFRHLEVSHGHNMLTLNGLFRLPRLHTRLYPYVGLGAGVALPHSEVQMAGDRGRTYEYQYAGPVVQALIGLEFRVPRMSYFVEYKFSLANYEMPLSNEDGSILVFDLWRQFERWWKGEEPPGGRLWTRLTSHQVIAGLGVRFGAAPVASDP
ncbi:MAG TPA: hypothetical protein VJ045_06245 [Hyphomicrobiaceae bacterium]|nr:hypothetical protein [Hyphomicrobiaceae bacterium]